MLLKQIKDSSLQQPLHITHTHKGFLTGALPHHTHTNLWLCFGNWQSRGSFFKHFGTLGQCPYMVEKRQQLQHKTLSSLRFLHKMLPSNFWWWCQGAMTILNSTNTLSYHHMLLVVQAYKCMVALCEGTPRYCPHNPILLGGHSMHAVWAELVTKPILQWRTKYTRHHLIV